MNKYIFIVFSIFVFSCSKDIEIEIPKQEPALVINSTIVPFTIPMPKSLNLKISETKHIYDSTNNYVENADVFLYKNNVLIDTLEYSTEDKTYPLNLFPTVGDEFSIIVKKNGYKTITARTTIPSKVIITDTVVVPIAYLDEFNHAVSEIAITFTDPADEINFYEIAVSDIGFSYENIEDFKELSTNDIIITSESYYPSLVRFDLIKPRFLLFKDTEINGQEHTFNIYYQPPQYTSDVTYIGSHYVTIHLRNVTEEYYNFKTSMLQHLYSKEENILYGQGEPLDVIGNIENGYGIFAGFNNDIASLRIDSLIISE